MASSRFKTNSMPNSEGRSIVWLTLLCNGNIMSGEDTLKNAKKVCDLGKLNPIHFYKPHAQKKYFYRPHAILYIDVISLKIQPHKTHKKAQSITPIAVLNEFFHGSANRHLFLNV